MPIHLNHAQQSAMNVIAGTGKPDTTTAMAQLALAQSLALPPRVIAHIEHYIADAREAARLASEAKNAAERASSAWSAVRTAAKQTDDLVDMAEAVAAASDAFPALSPELQIIAMQGREHFEVGTPLDANPFDAEGETAAARNAWEQGWLAAAHASVDEFGPTEGSEGESEFGEAAAE
jgi:hypothetical protein